MSVCRGNKSSQIIFEFSHLVAVRGTYFRSPEKQSHYCPTELGHPSSRQLILLFVNYHQVVHHFASGGIVPNAIAKIATTHSNQIHLHKHYQSGKNYNAP